MSRLDIDDPNYCCHNLGDERISEEEKEIERLSVKLRQSEAALRAAHGEAARLQVKVEKFAPVIASMERERDDLRERNTRLRTMLAMAAYQAGEHLDDYCNGLDEALSRATTPTTQSEEGPR